MTCLECTKEQNYRHENNFSWIKKKAAIHFLSHKKVIDLF